MVLLESLLLELLIVHGLLVLLLLSIGILRMEFLLLRVVNWRSEELGITRGHERGLVLG